MTKFGCKDYQDKTGVLIAQLGTPEAPTRTALHKYLKQFLWDYRVIEVNRLLWWFILNFIVLTFRPRKSAAAYQRIWTKEGSPLMFYTVKQTELVRDNLKKIDPEIEVEFGMRYGQPSLESAVEKLIKNGCTKILLFPMYPQYAAATTASTYDAVFKAILNRRYVPTLKVAQPYYKNKNYLRALAAIVNQFLDQHRIDKLVLSYHGIPESYIDKGDPYCCTCTESTNSLLPLINLKSDEVVHTYQSRFGKDPWLVPYTDVTLKSLPKNGVKKIAVFAPGFTADCLETLDEIGNEGRHLFIENGGEEFYLIPSLNIDPNWIEGMTQIIRDELGDWLEKSEQRSNCSTCLCPVKKEKERAANQNEAIFSPEKMPNTK